MNKFTILKSFAISAGAGSGKTYRPKQKLDYVINKSIENYYGSNEIKELLV